MKFLSVIILIFSIWTVKAQTGKVTYHVLSKNDQDQELVSKINTEFELMEFTLFYDANSSYFQLEPYLSKDELSGKLAKSLLNAKNSFEQTKKQSFTMHEVRDSTFKVNYTYRLNGWKLSNETTMIDDYRCYKATLDFVNKRSGKVNHFIAWYSPDIPGGYGPIGYGNLPGLILQLELRNAIFKVNKIILNPENIEVPKLENAPIITVDEYVNKMRAARMVTEEKE